MSDLRGEVLDVVVIGSGLAGMYALHTLRDGLDLSARVFDTEEGVDVTWRWHRLPADIEDDSAQIRRFAGHVADALDLRRDIRFGTRVRGAYWHENRKRWTVETNGGERIACRYLVNATSCLTLSQIGPPGSPR